MKPSMKSIVLGLVLAITTTFSPKSHALLVLTNNSGGDLSEMTFTDVLVCLVILPICLLDEEASTTSVSSESLLEQGYSPAEVNTIISEQAHMSELLLRRNVKLVVAETDTRTTIRQDIVSVMPSASETYINFILEMKGL